MMLKAALPSTTSFDASCHVSEAASEFVNVEQRLVAVDRRRHARRSSSCRCPSRARRTRRPDRREQDRLEQVHVRPLLADDERDDAGVFAFWSAAMNCAHVFGGRVMPAFLRTFGLYQRTFARWMFTGTEYSLPWYVIWLISCFGHDLAEAGLPVQEVDRLEIARLDVVLQLGARVTLERVGRVVGGEPLREHGLRVRPGAAGDGRVDELDVRVLLVPDRDDLGQAGGLAAARPPREDLEPARVAAAPLVAAGPAVPAAGTNSGRLRRAEHLSSPSHAALACADGQTEFGAYALPPHFEINR